MRLLTQFGMVLAVVLGLATPCFGQQIPRPSVSPLPDEAYTADSLGSAMPSWRAEDGRWQTLFDGGTTEAWRFLHGQPIDPRFWTVEAGLLQTLPGGQWGADIVTRQAFGDFAFCAEWKVDSGGNSGILYNVREDQWRGQDTIPGRVWRAWLTLAGVTLLFAVLFFVRRGVLRQDMARALVLGIYLVWLAHSLQPFERMLAYAHYMENWKSAGLEFQLYDDDGHRGATMQPNHGNGALYDIFPPTSRESKRSGEWNEACVVVEGKRVQHWLNGVQVLQYELESEELERAVARSRYRSIAGITLKQPMRVALQNHDGQRTWFRRVRVKPLD